MTRLGIKDKDFWEKVYDILIDTCNASPLEKEQFADTAGDFDEWRFGGSLGFGGKIWNDRINSLRVNYYSEDGTVGRDKMVKVANKKLDAFVHTYFADHKWELPKDT